MIKIKTSKVKAKKNRLLSFHESGVVVAAHQSDALLSKRRVNCLFIQCAIFQLLCPPPPTHTHTSYGFISVCSVCAAVYTGPQQAHTVSFALKANCMELLRIKVWIMIDAFINSSAPSCPSLVGPCSFQTRLFTFTIPHPLVTDVDIRLHLLQQTGSEFTEEKSLTRQREERK